MSQFAQLVKTKRHQKKLRLSEVAAALCIDKALVSKIERGDRLATQKQLQDFIAFYRLDKKNAQILWLSDKILALTQNENYAIDALQNAEIELKKQQNASPKKIKNNETNALLEKINALHKQYVLHLPLSTTQQEQMQVQYIFDNNKINGNELNLTETEAVIFDGKTINGKTMQDHLAAVNHYDALEQLKQEKGVLSLDLLCKIHAILYKGIDRRNAGKIRTKNIEASKNIQAISAQLIAKKIEELALSIAQKKDKTPVAILAIKVYCAIIAISPFTQGNAMLATWAMNFILHQNQFPLLWIESETFAQKDYQNSLYLCLKKQNPISLHLLFLRRLIDLLAIHTKL